MPHWKFICRYNTEKECFIRKMFGDYKHRNISKGDTLYLHKLPKSLIGPFVAKSDPLQNPVQQAWSEQVNANLKCQVKIDWTSTVYRISLGDVPTANLPIMPEDDTNFQKFTNSEGNRVRNALQTHGTVVVSPP